MLNGIMCGLFSPNAVFGATTPQLMAKAGIPVPAHTSLTLFLAATGTGLVLCCAAMLAARGAIRGARGADLAGRGEPAPADGPGATPAGATVPPAPSATLVRTAPAPEGAGGTGTAAAAPSRLALWSSAAALATLVGGGVVFSLHLGLLGLALAFALQLLLRLEPSALVHRLPWEIVLLIAGLLTYVGLMEHLGAFERITAALSVTGSPVLSLLAICFLAGLISFFASSIAVIATAVPLVAPLVAAGVSPVGAITAVALSAVLVDVNPLGITGGLLLGSAAPEHRDRLFRQLLGYGVCAIVLGPALAWAAFGWTL
ncbi:SLC13 family permease [Streptomyces sp. NPDC058372]|uniref:SLC13 family permease n=1 Tax=Streptomyces sp. NPDC058372 TaxID=3346464 RepID=UPI003669CAA1